MKKFTLSSMFLLFAAFSFAQLGVTAGVSESFFSGPYDYGKPTEGFVGGLTYKIKLGKHFDFQPEALYVHKGAKNKAEANTNFSTYYTQANAFLFYRAGFFSIGAAPYAGYLWYARNYNFFGPTYGWKVNDWDYYNRWDYGGAVAVEFDAVGGIFHFDYSHGLAKVRPKDPIYNTVLVGNTNSNFTARFTYPLWLKKDQRVERKSRHRDRVSRPIRHDISRRNYQPRQWKEPQTFSKF